MEKNGYVTIVKTPKYRWLYKKADEKKIIELKLLYPELPKPILEVLINRGFTNKKEIDEFFEAPLSGMLDPFLLKDIHKAVKRVIHAIKNREKICIYGDYDVDGITATSLMYEFLSSVTPLVDYYIPNRIEEGYSLNIDALNELKKKDVKVVITVDCGITSIDEIDYAKSIGLDTIVTDHHQLSDKLPSSAYAIINPQQPGDTYPFKHLSGVGVAFKFVLALKYAIEKQFDIKLPPLKYFLDLVALGTIADVVPMIGENRIFVKHGLKLLENSPRPGIAELKKISGLISTDLTSANIGYSLAPRINAVGRLGNSETSVKLLITKNQNEAKWLAEELETENRYRQELEKAVLKETIEKIERKKLNDRYKSIIMYSKNWHPGVIGIIASRLVERYSKPAIILSIDNDLAKGSARSIPNIDIFSFLKTSSDLLIEFGGHKYAAGLKLFTKNIRHLQRKLDEYIEKNSPKESLIPEIVIDAFLNPEDINQDLVKYINKLRPFGNTNSEPIFCMQKVKKTQEFSIMGKEKNIIKGFIGKNDTFFEVVGFNMGEYRDLIRSCDTFDIVFTIDINNWMGGSNIQLKIKDIKKSY
jgi:single-stranded-DNA-specific exonuclease